MDEVRVILTLVNGIGLLALLAIAYGTIKRAPIHPNAQSVLLGLATALAAIISLANPLEIDHGILIDNRTLIVGVGSAFGGPLTALVAASITGGVRTYLGGSGVSVGLGAIAVAVTAGLVWNRYLFRQGHDRTGSLFVLGLAIAVHGLAPLFLPIALAPRELTILIASLSGSSLLSTLLLGSLMTREDRQLKREDRLQSMASRDSLTELSNRRAFDRTLEEFASGVNVRTYAIALVDIDHFKGVNDRYGHAAGDLVLRSVAATLAGTIGRAGLVARYGGEEFAILLKDVDRPGAHAAMETIREAVENSSETDEDAIIRVTISIGLAVGNAGTATAEMIRAADNALYRAKETGRNRVESVEYGPRRPAEVPASYAGGALRGVA